MNNEAKAKIDGIKFKSKRVATKVKFMAKRWWLKVKEGLR